MLRTALRVCACLALAARAFAGSMNPDISMNALASWKAGNRGNDPAAPSKNGLNLDAVELQVASDIDPYLRGNVLLTASRDPLGAWGVEPEEAYVESLSLPGVTFKGGRFKAALGRHNQLHTHAFPFIDAPLAIQALVGDEGFSDYGVAAAALVPAPFFLELTGQAFNSRNPTLFNSPTTEDWAGLGSLKELWELSDDATLELVESYLAGRNASDDLTWLGSVSATMKWRHDESHALILAGEMLQREIQRTRAQDVQGGVSGWLQWQFARRWWLQARAELLEWNIESYPQIRKYSALLALLPTEFSGWRLQYDWIEASVNNPEHRLTLQLNVTMGVHPAHSY